ncbi:hypothetical protein SAMN05660485_01741 [Blastococcus fimeti]|nr:hypothetical protein SAMN05660485_01741 [Blastococcus fimeti]
MDSRAAVFTSSPQSVEVFQAGTWWAGELLGWRHDASGTCQMWVRVVVGGVEETAWIELAALRLPDTETSPSAGAGRMDSRVKQVLPPAQAISALRGRTVGSDAATTSALPMIRDEAPAPAAAERRTGRRRAPEEALVDGAAPVEVAPVADTSVRTVPAAGTTAAAGRHRAPDDEGRHRAADTEVFGAVTDATDQFPAVEPDRAPEPRRTAARPHAGAGWVVPGARAARPEESFGRAEVCTGRIDVEPDLLTRPMRLSDLAPSSRRPRLSGSRTS